MIVVTGASGCLGQALVQDLAEARLAVAAVVRAQSRIEFPKGVARVELDLARPLDVSLLPNRCDAVIHLAQSRAYRDFPGSILEIVEINVGATVELAKYAADAGAKAFIFASSGSVYAPNRDRIPETAPTDTTSFYAASKIAAEALLRAFESKLSVVVMRLFALYGPGQTDKVIAQIASRMCEGKPIDLYGQDGHHLTPTFTGDVARMMRRAIGESWPGGIYNVAAPEIRSLRDIGVKLAELLNIHPIFEVKSKSTPLPTLPDLTKLTALIGDDRFLSLEEGLKKTFLQGASSAVGR